MKKKKPACSNTFIVIDNIDVMIVIGTFDEIKEKIREEINMGDIDVDDVPKLRVYRAEIAGTLSAHMDCSITLENAR